MKKTTSSKKSCVACGSHNLKTHLTTYSVQTGPRQLNIERVSASECMDCHALKPTKAGQAKIERCMGAFMMLLDRD